MEVQPYRIGQLHRVAEFDPGPALRPVIAAARGGVQHLGGRAHLVVDSVLVPQRSAGPFTNVLELSPVPRVQLVITPGVEDVLAVAVEGEVQHEVVLTAQQEVPDGAGLGLGEGGGASESFFAGIVACSVSSPVITKVSVEINTLTLL